MAMESGLSPRVRGNLRRPGLHRPGNGSIPARAGEPATLLAFHNHVRVYPRACGGTEISRQRRQSKLGLSPRVRGNRDDGAQGGHQERSIPARAGEPATASGNV